VPRAKYAMDYRPIDSFSMSYASRKVIFPGGALKRRDTLAKASGHRQKVWSEAKVKPCSPPKRGKDWQNQALSVVVEGVC